MPPYSNLNQKKLGKGDIVDYTVLHYAIPYHARLYYIILHYTIIPADWLVMTQYCLRITDYELLVSNGTFNPHHPFQWYFQFTKKHSNHEKTLQECVRYYEQMSCLKKKIRQCYQRPPCSTREALENQLQTDPEVP